MPLSETRAIGSWTPHSRETCPKFSLSQPFQYSLLALCVYLWCPRDQVCTAHLLSSLGRPGAPGGRSLSWGFGHSTLNASTWFGCDHEGWWFRFNVVLCPLAASLPQESLILIHNMCAWPWPGWCMRGLEKESQHKKNPNPNPKWFILGFPVSECLLKTQEPGQALLFWQWDSIQGDKATEGAVLLMGWSSALFIFHRASSTLG